MIKLIAMDMDGTITQHKSGLDEVNRNALERLREKYQLVIVGAGTCERIHNQLKFCGVDLIGSYGMQYGTVAKDGLILQEDNCVSVNREDVEERVARFRAEYNFQTYEGESVEFHKTGMVTIPLIGTRAQLQEKLDFDPDRKIRRAVHEKVKELFPEYTVFVGGTSSFDMAPRPYDKLYALKKYAKEKGFSEEEIVYLGDDYGPGGNDEQIYHSEIRFITVDSYLDYANKVKEFL